jgi:molybdate transport system substrate-binding protein
MVHIAFSIAGRRLVSGLMALLVFLVAARSARGAERELLVFAAASLTNVLEELGATYSRETAQPVKFSFAASSALARQLEAGAKADVFLSADLEWMDYVQARGLIERRTRRDLLGNRLVLIAPASSPIALEIAPGFPLAEALGRGRLATGDPDYVPVGRYARSALTSLGVWSDVADRLVRADNVRTALAFVSRGEAPLGIVYATDAKVDPGVRVVSVFPDDTHLPITYPVAVTAGAAPGATRFVEFLGNESSRTTFRKSGFITFP